MPFWPIVRCRGRRGRVSSELFAGSRDYLAGRTPEEKVATLARTSYRAFLTDICKLPAGAADFFQGRSSDNFGYGVDAISAIDAMGEGFPGAGALKIEDQAGGHADEKAAYVHHFPDGNASLARALVRSLVVRIGARPHHGRPRDHGLRLRGLGPIGCARAHPPAGDRRQGAQHGGRQRGRYRLRQGWRAAPGAGDKCGGRHLRLGDALPLPRDRQGVGSSSSSRTSRRRWSIPRSSCATGKASSGSARTKSRRPRASTPRSSSTTP